MSPKQTALIQTAKLFAVALLIGALTSLVFAYFTVSQIGIGFCIVMLAYLGKMIYDMELSKAEHLQTLKKLNDIK
jgi:hypothetical protein